MQRLEVRLGKHTVHTLKKKPGEAPCVPHLVRLDCSSSSFTVQHICFMLNHRDLHCSRIFLLRLLSSPVRHQRWRRLSIVISTITPEESLPCTGNYPLIQREHLSLNSGLCWFLYRNESLRMCFFSDCKRDMGSRHLWFHVRMCFWENLPNLQSLSGTISEWAEGCFYNVPPACHCISAVLAANMLDCGPPSCGAFGVPNRPL